MSPIECTLLHKNYDINLAKGTLTHCCRFDSISAKPNEISALGYKFFDQNAETQQARNDLANGVQTKRCHDCWDLEKKNIPSWRQLKSKNYKEDELGLNLQLSTLCNQACFYCTPSTSTSIAKYGVWIGTNNPAVLEKPENYSSTEFTMQHVSDFVKHLDPNIKKLNLSLTGGEPFMIENFENSLVELLEIFLSTDESRTAMIAASTNTNTKTSVVNHFYNKLNRLKFRNRIRVGIISSIENIEERAEYVRDGLVWSNFEENFKIHHEYADSLIVRPTLNPFSIVNITEFFKYFLAYSEVRFIYNYPFQEYFRVQVLDNRFMSEMQRLNDYILSTNTGYRFEQQFHKFLPDLLKDDKANARLFKKAITNIDKIKNKNWRPIFPEYVEWFDAIED